MFPINTAQLSEGVLLVIYYDTPILFMRINWAGAVEYITHDPETIRKYESDWLKDLDDTELDCLADIDSCLGYKFYFMDA
jgi:hypothetical protein